MWKAICRNFPSCFSATHQKSCRHKKWFAFYVLYEGQCQVQTHKMNLLPRLQMCCILHCQTQFSNCVPHKVDLAILKFGLEWIRQRPLLNSMSFLLIMTNHIYQFKAFKTNLFDGHMRSMKSSKLLYNEYIRNMFYIPKLFFIDSAKKAH